MSLDNNNNNNTNKKSVAIIGGGASGLCSCKHIIENGNGLLVPTIFERYDQFGGTWSPSNSKAWNSLNVNVSKYSCEFSDFQYKSSNLFPTKNEVYQYLYDYSKHFNILQYIKTNCNVINVKYCKSTLKWIINWIDIKQQQQQQQSFDFIIIACGVNNKPASINNNIDLTNISDNNTKIIHSKDYKSSELYNGKKVLIIGNGSSGSQICNEIAMETTNDTIVHHLIKTVKWMLPFTILQDDKKGGCTTKTIDSILFKRSLSYQLKELNENDRNKSIYKLMKEITNNNYNCKEYNIDELKYSTLPQNYIFTNPNYLKQVYNGRIKVLTSTTIKEEYNYYYDNIIICNGYNLDLSFLDNDILKLIQFNENEIFHPIKNLYKFIFLPEINSISFVGMFNSPYYASIELMSRWVSLIYSNKLKLNHSFEEMKEWINKNNIKNTNNGNNSKPQTPYGDHVLFCDDLANEIGCLPNFNQIKFSDPNLYNKLWYDMFKACDYI